MTLAIAVVSADGVVLAADSRTSFYIGPSAPGRVLSDFTHKVFEVGNLGVATYGWAFLLKRNIAGHMAEFSQGVGESANDPEAFVDALATFFGDRIDNHITQGLDSDPGPIDQLGFLVGAFSNGIGTTYEIALPSRTVTELHTTMSPGAAWRGQTDVIGRLVKGLDGDLLGRDAVAADLGSEFTALVPVFEGLEYVIPFQAMNLQDAIDFAVLAIRTTIDVQRLTFGTMAHAADGSWPGVGGPIEIATLTASEGFTWVAKAEPQGERPAGQAERI